MTTLRYFRSDFYFKAIPFLKDGYFDRKTDHRFFGYYPDDNAVDAYIVAADILKTREEYLAFISEWKNAYLQLTRKIREAKSLRTPGEHQSAYQETTHWGRVIANRMLRLRKAVKRANQRRIAAEKSKAYLEKAVAAKSFAAAE